MGKVRLFVVLTFHRSIIKPDGIEIIGSLNYRLFLNNGKKALYSARLEKYTPSPVIKPTNNNTRKQAALRNNAMKKLLANENEINWNNI